ncbi:MAG: MFS transporter [Novosphingobium sp.]|uniref:MFS transporter n=1 Tax=Novosphingobium sp. TaxID=1874826 RepID=UPI0012CC249F|nr:MFS transporter [Novosphingobium sp.]MPS69716.1 MFS transporter [Novosphingobium sp.]
MTEVPAETSADPRAVAMMVAFVMFLSILEATVIATALPDMARDFGVAPSGMGIGITAYLLVSTAFLPLSSWAAQRLGPRRVLTGSVLGFGLASLLCSLSTGLAFFVAARALQALCSSLMTPVGNLVLLRVTPKHRLVEMLAISTTPALIAPVIGPPLGGLLTETLGWQSIFLINLPLTLIGALLTRKLIPRIAPRPAPFDPLCFALVAIALALLIYGFDRLGAHPGAALLPAAMIACGSAAALLAFRYLRARPDGLVPLTALRHTTFRSIAFGAGMLMRIPHMGQALVLPLYFQLAFGMSPGLAGLLLLANNLGDLALKPVVGRVIRASGFRMALSAGTAMMMASLAAIAAFTAQMSPWLMAAAMLLVGMARSVPFTGMVSLAFADVAQEELPGAIVLNSIGNALSAAIGISLGALFLNLRIFTPDSAEGPYRLALVALALIGMGAVPLFARLPAEAGARITARPLREGQAPA